ncbi:hypothetical protein SAMN05444149_102688 [Pseudosulfitobacter pseudonitzschiae]|uniref:Uncharacterized protein n=1 Tax=Pseudosulfitobacter pseudonitzschiae TaxID=1402135 RepID=A0A073J3B5_9RHOB|nr:hypothetical protein [Pseudosulfitobacter pseudonitzschiae]KEJ96320.1 hypothetical protein SUH3_18845 [Pseudosulfitobacter pseudonitzschiae]SHF04885.1 hypothetical protein SAMN05444149_102688 [Pseudosulfitobacter pseudonitzschiae]
MKLTTAAILAFTILTTPASAFDGAVMIKTGPMVKAETAGILGARITGQAKFCTSEIKLDEIDTAEINRLAGVYAAMGAGIADQTTREKIAARAQVMNGSFHAAKWPRTWRAFECQSLHATAVNFGLMVTRAPTESERDELKMLAALHDNNCFYEGKLPADREALWRFLAMPRHDYLTAVLDVDATIELLDAGATMGTSDDFDCDRLGAFGAKLETAQ